MVATSFIVATSFSQCLFSVDVATSVTCRDIVVFLFFQLQSCDNSFRLRPLFSLYDDFRLSLGFLGRDCVGGLLPSQVLIFCRDLMVMSRPLLLPISFSSGRNLSSLLQLISSFPLSIRSRPQVDVVTWISSA